MSNFLLANVSVEELWSCLSISSAQGYLLATVILLL